MDCGDEPADSNHTLAAAGPGGFVGKCFRCGESHMVKDCSQPPKENEELIAPAMPSAGKYQSYRFAVRTAVISGIPTMAEEVAEWWGEIWILSR